MIILVTYNYTESSVIIIKLDYVCSSMYVLVNCTTPTECHILMNIVMVGLPLTQHTHDVHETKY